MRKRDFRIKIKDNRLFPVQAFFNAIGDDAFVRVVKDLQRRVGTAINDCYCEFPEELDYDEEPFDGIRFSLFEDEVIISEEELNAFLKKVCSIHLIDYPEDRKELIDFL